MEITYDYYRVFYYVARCRSFSKAAEVLLSNQPNITRFMNNLESQLGCKLFVRSNRGVTLTPEGEKLYRHVSAAFAHLHLAEQELANDQSLEKGMVSIGLSEIALHLFVLPVLSRFHEEFPGIHLRISNHTTPHAIQTVKNGMADFAVVSTPLTSNKTLRSTSLRTFKDILVGSPRLAGLAGKRIRLSDLDNLPLVGMAKDTTTYEFYSNFFYEHGAKLKPDVEAASLGQMLPMIISGLGIGFLPEDYAKEAIEQKKVVPIFLEEPIPEREICLIEVKDSPLTAAAKTLKKMLMDR